MVDIVDLENNDDDEDDDGNGDGDDNDDDSDDFLLKDEEMKSEIVDKVLKVKVEIRKRKVVDFGEDGLFNKKV